MIRISNKRFEHVFVRKDRTSLERIFKNRHIKILYWHDSNGFVIKAIIKIRKDYPNLIHDNTLFVINGVPKSRVRLIYSDSIIRIFKSKSKKVYPNYIITIL